MSYKKPPLPTIKVNGRIFNKLKDLDCLRVSFYRCADPQLEVRIYWNEAYQKWSVFGGNRDFNITQDLTDNLAIPETHVDNYWTEEQEKAVYRYITESMLAAENK